MALQRNRPRRATTLRMLSMHGVPSALVARNESWVRKQAQALVRHLPANVERADLIQVGLIALAQASLTFRWEGDPDSEAGREAFIRYTRQRVRGAMLDELRQMDALSRGQRRKVKILQIARERWRRVNGRDATLGELAGAVKMSLDEVAELDRLAAAASPVSATADEDEPAPLHAHPATEKDEVEARVDTAIVMRHLEPFFASLPERERQVLDAYLGVGLTPVELAASLRLSPSRITQIYDGIVRRIAVRLGHAPTRSGEAGRPRPRELEDTLVAERERAWRASEEGAWGDMMEDVLKAPDERFGIHIGVPPGTRWG